MVKLVNTTDLRNQMKKCKAYKSFEKDFHKLYGANLVVYGPYKRKQDGRRIVVIYDGTRRTTKLYAKVKLEIKIGHILSKDETVDHIDKNPFNDKFSNLRMLSREKNARRSALNNKNCLGYKQSEEQKRNGEKNGMALMTNLQVRKFRKKYRCGIFTVKDIMHIAGISRRSVVNMLKGLSYVHAGGPVA